jgi:hypothetical protein
MSIRTIVITASVTLAFAAPIVVSDAAAKALPIRSAKPTASGHRQTHRVIGRNQPVKVVVAVSTGVGNGPDLSGCTWSMDDYVWGLDCGVGSTGPATASPATSGGAGGSATSPSTGTQNSVNNPAPVPSGPDLSSCTWAMDDYVWGLTCGTGTAAANASAG